MSGRFPNSLRARPGVITVADSTSGAVVRFRVEAPAVWDVVRIDAHSADSVRTAKVCALNALIPDALFPEEFSVKLAGVEIFDESKSLAESGVVDGSTLLLSHRRRRPVR
ncbi:MAG: hypothetical protein M3Z30_05430 [Gemmatimonadota bacterium]|nr:hypothetical protein [Gemmatimonadota bacterium]